MSRAGSQVRTLVGILGRLSPHWRTDPALPARIDSTLGRDRRLGSRDRRLYRELVYTALRYLPWVEGALETDPREAARRIAWLAPDSPLLRDFRGEVAAGLPPCPQGTDEKARVLGADVRDLTPAWFAAECAGALLPPLRETLLSRAPLWIRLQTDEPERVLSEFDRRGWDWRRSPQLPTAVRVPQDAAIADTDAFRSGMIEVQDAGSQLVLESAGPAPGGAWLDACAGAGGKTLQLAAMLGAAGRVAARDPRPSALAELSLRALRAGLAERIDVEPRTEPHGGYDGVLVDAPCSGSGTWRRSPHLRWVTTPESVIKAAALQRRLLITNAPKVRAGGLLVYATCSLCRTENESVTEHFLGEIDGFKPVLRGRTLLPQEHDGDGFFVATFRRT